MGRLLGVKFLIFLFLPGSLFAGTSLPGRIDQILKTHHLSSAKVSIKMIRLSDGSTLYERDPDRLLNPASVAKLVTAAAALKVLGSDYTYKTEFSSQRKMADGKIQDLWVKGYGDPFFVTEELEALVQRFRAEGLQRIEGSLFVDDTYFDREQPVTYLSDSENKVTQVVTGPLSLNFNSIEIRARPGPRLGDQPFIELEPPTTYIRIINEARTTGRARPSLEARGGLENQIQVRGNIPKRVREFSLRHGVVDPATYTGTLFLEALQRAGVSVAREVHRQAVPPGTVPIMIHSSPPLREIVNGLGKHSNNFIAEQIFQSLGAVRFGPPASQRKGRMAVGDYLFSLGIPEGEYYLENGSGLSKLSRLSAAQLVRVLEDQEAQPWRGDFISSLSVAGVDGTLRHKLGGSLRGKVFAKTGTLNQVSSLAGYLMSGEERVAFALLFNDFNVSVHRVLKACQKILEAVEGTRVSL